MVFEVRTHFWLMSWYYFKTPYSEHELDVRIYFLAVNKNAIRDTHNVIIAQILENRQGIISRQVKIGYIVSF